MHRSSKPVEARAIAGYPKSLAIPDGISDMLSQNDAVWLPLDILHPIGITERARKSGGKASR